MLFMKQTITQPTLGAKQAALSDMLPDQEAAILGGNQSSKFLVNDPED